MKLRSSLAALLLCSAMAASPFAPALAQQAADQTFTAPQKDAIKKVVREYLMENPEIIAEAIEALQEKEKIAAETTARKALVDRKADLFEDKRAPVLGNPKGDVTVVAFLDYRCPYCKSVDDTIFDVIKADGKVRLIIKEMPVLGPDSVLAARVALAAEKHGKYEVLHRALMKVKGPVNDAVIYKTAAEAGLNIDALRKDAEDESLIRALKDNLQLGRTLGISGTPGFVIGSEIVPGQIPAEALKQMIAQARKPKP